MLRLDKAPYLFVALVGIFTWSMNNIIENTKLSPIVEYAFENLSNSDMARLEISNLSSTQCLRGLTFKICDSSFVSADNSKNNAFKNVSLEAVPPAFSTTEIIENLSISGKCFDLKISEFQPDNTFIVSFTVFKNYTPTIELIDSNKQTVRVKKRSLITYAIRNQVSLNIFIIIASLILLIVYSLFLNLKK